jgi:hypothetical protein
MRRRGPLSGSVPRSDSITRVAGRHSHDVSDAGRASPPSNSSALLPKSMATARFLASAALIVFLTARRRGRFDASLNGIQIVKASTQPICCAARALHRLSYSDAPRLNFCHRGSEHHAISGLLGYWRRRRFREDRGLRYVAWEPRPRGVGVKKRHDKAGGALPGAKGKNLSRTTPGARPSADTPTLTAGGTP